MDKFNNVVVVGVGSVGTKHALFLKPFSKKLILVDPIFSSLKWQDKYHDFESALRFTSLNDLDLKLTEGDLAVISNWGPDHYSTILNLSSRGIKNFVLEKPCADSLLEIENLLDIAQVQKLRIAVNQGWYYDKLGPRINQMAKNLNLGDAKAIFISGGARCISTAGSHWISLANQIFSNDPQLIFSSARSDSINPRSRDLAYYEGVFSFSYPDNKRLAICLTNGSSVEGRVEVYWRDAIGIILQDQFTIYSRRDFPNPSQITKYGPASNLIYNEPMNSSQKSFLNLYETFKILKQEEFYEDLKKHLSVTRSIICALISSEVGVQIDFSKKPDSNFYDRKFKIS